MRARLEPIRQRIIARDVGIDRIRLSRSDHLMKNLPDRIAIPFSCRTDFYWLLAKPTTLVSQIVLSC
jgi:hypothetical protein